MRSNLQHYLYLIMLSWTVKLLLIPSYFSTDFQVHQNWIRITHQFPISQWYYNDDSKWTLDYPPLFAYLEYIIGKFASIFISKQIVSDLNTLPITIYYQRITVIVSDLLYLLIVAKYEKWQITPKLIILYFFIPFIMLDNMHFQYNLLLQALFVLSIYFMEEKKYLLGAFTYSLLLNFKHIYLYCALAYFIYLLVNYVIVSSSQNTIADRFRRLIKLAVVTLVPFIISFGPFLLATGLPGIQQIFTRLFPFGRGLIHEYWAPNFWALYHFLDKFLFVVSKRLPFLFNSQYLSINYSSTGNQLRILPQISPLISITIILLFQMPLVYKTWLNISKMTSNKSIKSCSINFVSLLCVSGLFFFIFGYHVHEKAITPYISVIFMFLGNVDQIGLAIFVNIVNLIPLFIRPAERTLLVILCAIWMAIWEIYSEQPKKKSIINQLVESSNLKQLFTLKNLKYVIQEIVMVTGWILVLYYCVFQSFIKSQKLAFMPLMLNSIWAGTFNCVWSIYLYYELMKKGQICRQD